MVDDVRHLDLVDSVRPRARRRCGSRSTSTPGCGSARPHVGPKRSPLHDAADVVELGAGDRRAATGFRLVGVMTYEGQVAGVPDEVPRPAGPLGRGASA